jgi:hypothetical protein
MTEARVVVDYLHWIVVPDLSVLGLYHDDYLISRGWLFPVSTMLSLFLLAGLFGLALWLKRRRPLVTVGILFFLAGQSLVSTYLPLELVYEHRNYLPCFGVFLAIFSVLLLDVKRGPWRVAGLGLSAGLISLSGFITLLRAEEWADPARLAYIEASRHPESPRANYEFGRALADRATDADGFAYSMAVKSFEASSRLPDSGLLPLQALVYMSAKHGRQLNPEIWRAMERVIASGPLARQDVTALYALIACVRGGTCRFDPERLGVVLALAVKTNPTQADLKMLYANYAINVARDYRLGLSLMQRAVALDPLNSQYWENLISLQIALGQVDEARAGISYVRELNRFGRLNEIIGRLEAAIPAHEGVDAHQFSGPDA